jgi:hypothetical protein
MVYLRAGWLAIDAGGEITETRRLDRFQNELNAD